MYFKTDAPVMPELAASKDNTRPVLTIVHLDTEHSEVRVTDSYMAARFPVEIEEGDTSGPIPLEALKASRKSPFKFLAKTSIRANSHVDVVAGTGEDASAPYVTMPRNDIGDYTYPNLDQLWPDNLHSFKIAISAERLLALAKAMGAAGKNGGVVLQFCNTPGPEHDEPSDIRPIMVTPLGDTSSDAPSGILMPIRIR